MGGLSRRATTIEKIRGEGTTFVVDAGDLFWREAQIGSAVLPQQQEKAKLQAEAFALAGVDAMLAGGGDLALGLDFVKGLADKHALPYVASDLVCDGKAPFPAVRVVERGGLTLAAVGLVGEVEVPGCTRTEAGPAVRAALEGVDADVVVLLSGDPNDATERVAKAVGGVDFVVVADRRALASPQLLDGGALRLGMGSRGKHLGALTFTLVPGATGWRDDGAVERIATDRDRAAARVQEFKDRLGRLAPDAPAAERTRIERQIEVYGEKVAGLDAKLKAATASAGPANTTTHTLYDLTAAVADHAATLALVERAKLAIAGAAAADEGVPADSPYAGTAACIACHSAQHAQWSTTPHARAWATLVAKKSQYDDACFACHVTGARQPGGPAHARAAETAGLMDVGCESCHGPGRAHIADPTAGGMVRNPPVETCTTCHDGTQDGGRFVEADYRPKVVHQP